MVDGSETLEPKPCGSPTYIRHNATCGTTRTLALEGALVYYREPLLLHCVVAWLPPTKKAKYSSNLQIVFGQLLVHFGTNLASQTNPK